MFKKLKQVEQEGEKMGNAKPVERCPKCKEGNETKCKVEAGEGYFLTLKCTECGFTWNTLDVHALPKKQKSKPVKRKFPRQVGQFFTGSC